ncbi:hypothetical protein BG015_000710 [Linnemannia schmuckeri]|uniref:Uncharacterized protein n=1 Tax=Linnemannia schmuckeri TaxID=64567 RepID=A0A9P5V7F7_9FUNG|nr:hypothetical protein BG015_000710 [Linnemannia schmuckeri]
MNAFEDATTSSGFGFGSISSASGFGASDLAPTNAFGGATMSSTFGFGYTTPAPALSGIFDSSHVSTSAGLFFGNGGDAYQRAKSAATAKKNRDAEAILVTILKRSPRLEFLIVSSHCLESEAVVKLAGESLLFLKEFYSQDSLWAAEPTGEFRLHGKSYIPYSMTYQPEVKGLLRQPRGARSFSLLNNYPWLRALQLNIAAGINDKELRKIRRTNRELLHLEIHCGDAVGQTCRQILIEASGLISVNISQYERDEKMPSATRTGRVFLKHAPTLEHLYVSGCGFDDECSGPSMRMPFTQGPLSREKAVLLSTQDGGGT